MQLPTKLPCSPCDVTVVKQRSKPGREWEREGGGGRRGRGRGRRAPGSGEGQSPKAIPEAPRRHRAVLPPKPGFHRNANRPESAFLPAGEEGCRGACRPRVGPSGFGGLGEGGSAEGDSQEGGQATRSLGRPHGGGTLEFGDTLYLSRENGRISENATRAPTGGEAA